MTSTSGPTAPRTARSRLASSAGLSPTWILIAEKPRPTQPRENSTRSSTGRCATRGRADGIELTLAVNHLAHLIQAYFGDGARFGVKIDYSQEDKPLSTIGPLTLIDDLPETFLVMNGDIVCNLDYRAFFEAHVAARVPVSVAAFRRETKIDFGVLDLDERNRLVGFREKPIYHFDVSMGIYGLNRSVIERLAP